jgi:two-component system, cell cycle sensor histidine kinase and response regulator CckA
MMNQQTATSPVAPHDVAEIDAVKDVIIIEDEPAHAAAICRALGRGISGSSVRVATTLAGYRELVAARPPDIALLDLNLPDGKAVEVLRTPPEAGAFPVLIMTSHGSEQMAVTALKAGALDYIVKSPDIITDMPHVLERALKEWRLLRERRRYNEERLRLAKLESIGILAGGIAHDFNNILTAILGNITIARQEAAPGSELHEVLSEAESAATRAKGLTRQLLTFAKGGAPVKKRTDLRLLLREATSLALRGSNVRSSLEVKPGLWDAEVDEEQVSQVITNIVLNGKQAMPMGGTLEICAENSLVSVPGAGGLPLTPGRYLKLSFSDHGEGIPPENQEKIFEPFFTTKKDGTGLGLTTSLSIVRHHGGHIQAFSTPGHSSTFVVYLPACPPKPEVPLAEVPPDEICFHGERVLVMDDEPSIRLLVTKMLRHLGFGEVATAADGQEAIRLYEEARVAGRPYVVVIMDMTVPGGMGGQEAVARLVALDPAVRTVASSGSTSEIAGGQYKKLGFCASVDKPYTLEQLARTLWLVLPRGERRP